SISAGRVGWKTTTGNHGHETTPDPPNRSGIPGVHTPFMTHGFGFAEPDSPDGQFMSRSMPITDETSTGSCPSTVLQVEPFHSSSHGTNPPFVMRQPTAHASFAETASTEYKDDC